jgi:hypothetical protein
MVLLKSCFHYTQDWRFLDLHYEDNFYCCRGGHWLPKGQAFVGGNGRLFCPVHRKALRLRVQPSILTGRLRARLRKAAKLLEVSC